MTKSVAEFSERMSNLRRFVARFAPLVRPKAPIARSSHGLSAFNGSLYVIGGEAEARTPIDMAVHVLPGLEAEAGEWRTISADERAPPARIAHAQATVGDELVIFGGRAGVQMEEAALDDLWSFNPTTESWSSLEHRAGEPPCPRSFHTATSVGSKMYVFGGCGESGRLADLHEACSDQTQTSGGLGRRRHLSETRLRSLAACADCSFASARARGAASQTLQASPAEGAQLSKPRPMALPCGSSVDLQVRRRTTSFASTSHARCGRAARPSGCARARSARPSASAAPSLDSVARSPLQTAATRALEASLVTSSQSMRRLGSR